MQRLVGGSPKMVEPLQAIEIGNRSLHANVITYGASLTDLRLTGKDTPLVLGYADPSIYPFDQQFMGSVIGRYGNRIADGRFRLNDQEICLEQNETGIGHLHGGSNGLWNRHWELAKRTATKAVLEVKSDNGDAGYPGTLILSASYEIVEPATLRLTFLAACDRDTIINICHHPYFNFSGTHPTEQHMLQINADCYLPSSKSLLPTGSVARVEGTSFDFRKERLLGKVDRNNTFCLHRKSSGELLKAARLSCADISMELWTTQPGIHLYNGYKLSRKHTGHLGSPYPPRSGICLEAQAWPNSPNEPAFPNTVLRADTTYRQVTEYRF